MISAEREKETKGKDFEASLFFFFFFFFFIFSLFSFCHYVYKRMYSPLLVMHNDPIGAL
jgi:hypothetical protein